MGNACLYRLLTLHQANSLQGAKAQQKRERNAEKNAPKGAKSQAKSNEAAKNIVCAICRQSFVSSFLFLFAQWCSETVLSQLVTTRAPAYEDSCHLRLPVSNVSLFLVSRSIRRISTPNRWQTVSQMPRSNTRFLGGAGMLHTRKTFDTVSGLYRHTSTTTVRLVG